MVFVSAGYNGDASRHVIRDMRTLQELAIHTEALLSETEYKSFWMTWTNNTITVGTGSDVGDVTTAFLNATIEFGFVTRTVAMLTSNDVVGRWRTHKDLGNAHVPVAPTPLLTHAVPSPTPS